MLKIHCIKSIKTHAGPSPQSRKVNLEGFPEETSRAGGDDGKLMQKS